MIDRQWYEASSEDNLLTFHDHIPQSHIIQDDETALHIAAYHGHVEVVKVLTENQDKFVINARDKVSS